MEGIIDTVNASSYRSYLRIIPPYQDTFVYLIVDAGLRHENRGLLIKQYTMSESFVHLEWHRLPFHQGTLHWPNASGNTRVK